jgi:hypothetical protein
MIILYRRLDYDERRTGQTLNFNTTLSKVEHSAKVVSWTYSPDGLLRSGDSVLIRNKKNNGYLAADIGSRQAGVDESYLINCSKTI